MDKVVKEKPTIKDDKTLEPQNREDPIMIMRLAANATFEGKSVSHVAYRSRTPDVQAYGTSEVAAKTALLHKESLPK